MPQHDLLVVPSWFEAYGLTFLEARAAGLPVVARRAFAMPELVPEGRAGLLIPADGGEPDVAEAILQASGNEELYRAVARDAETVARDHSWASVVHRMLEVINSAGGSHRTGAM